MFYALEAICERLGLSKDRVVMPKLTFLGAGSTVFAKNLLGDCLLVPELSAMEISLYDIDAKRLEESTLLVQRLNESLNRGQAKVTSHVGVEERKAALAGASYVINAIQVGGYEPSTLTDFEIPRKFGLRQTIGDTVGIGGIFRALRTIPVLEGFVSDIEVECPDALLLNYTNPMAMLTGWLQGQTNVRAVGLCHSVQSCVAELFKGLGIERDPSACEARIAGINHMAWLVELRDGEGRDLYPEIKELAREKLAIWRKAPPEEKSKDMVRFQMMLWFGHYVTESSEHSAEYTPYWIKSQFSHLIDEFNIPLDEYPRRCVQQIAEWNGRAGSAPSEAEQHRRGDEYASHIIEAMVTGKAFTFAGNVLNSGGLISNLPETACVEVPVIADADGLRPQSVAPLPEPCAALNRTNINPQLLTIRAAISRKREDVYQAALLDPHTSSELSPDEIIALCQALFAAHRDWLPHYS